jgi:hypothetical protein
MFQKQINITTKRKETQASSAMGGSQGASSSSSLLKG